MLALTQIVPAQLWVLLPTLLLVCIAIVALLIVSGSHRPLKTRKTYFYIVVLTCLVLAAGWLISALSS
jgi:hypothetical protein